MIFRQHKISHLNIRLQKWDMVQQKHAELMVFNKFHSEVDSTITRLHRMIRHLQERHLAMNLWH